MKIQETVAYQYAKWGSSGRNHKVGRYVKLQEKKWMKIADGKVKDVWVDEKEAEKIYKILDLMVHPDLHVPMSEGLEPYANLFIMAVLCTKTKNVMGQEVRYYETGLLEIARKNFKTFTSAVIFIVLMLTDEKYSRFFSVAPDKDIASELWLAINKIIKESPDLYNEYEQAFEILRSEIRCKVTNATYKPLAYGKDRMDSRTANGFLADEAGAMDNYPIEAMRSSQITLPNKLGIVISTQYPSDDNALIDEIDIAKKTLEGLLQARVFALLFEPDDALRQDEAWMKSDNAIYQANPVAIDNKIVFESIKSKRAEAILYENKRENFLCKHLNIKYRSLGVEGYIDIQKFKRCVKKQDKAWWAGRAVYLGMDLSQTDDNTAVAMVTSEGDTLYVKVFGFIPKSNVDLKTHREKLDYWKLIRRGDCYACGDETIDYGFVERFILDLEEAYGVQIMQCGYDRYNALSTVQKLEEAGIECVEIKQHSSVLHSPTKLLKEKVLNRKLLYEDNELLENNIMNARCVEDTNKNKYVNKKKSAGKVDMVVAAINAIYLWEQEQLYSSNFTVQVV